MQHSIVNVVKIHLDSNSKLQNINGRKTLRNYAQGDNKDGLNKDLEIRTKRLADFSVNK